MRYTIENEFLTAAADTVVGEIRGLRSKKTGKDYMWIGDPEYWERVAPVLFPVCCSATDNQIIVDDKTYPMPKHGFVRQSTFTVTSQTADSLTFELRESEETLKMYPYKFCLRFRYTLKGSSLVSEIEVENTNDEAMYFSVGGHPALMCPFNKNEAFGDYFLEFSERETLDTALLDGQYLNGSKPYIINETRLNLAYGVFEHDALIFNNYRSDKIFLRSRKSENYLSMTIGGYPWLGIWTVHRPDAPFVCVEPWHGIPDVTGFRGELKDKKSIVSLEAGKTFACGYTIEVHE